MKNLFTFLLLTAFIAGIQAQELDSLKAIMGKKDASERTGFHDSSSFGPVLIRENGDEVNVKVMDHDVVKVIDNQDSTYVKVGDRGMVRVIDHPDSTRIRLGNKEISIVDKGDNTDVSFHRTDDVDKIGHRKFRGHWAGVEWGINNFLDKDFTISREGGDEFMDLNTGRSWAINFNFAQYSLGFGTSHVGMLTGLGLEFNNYFFDRNNTIAEINDQVVGVDTSGFTKSKLTASFLRVPLVLEFQFPNVIRSRRIFFSAGLVAGLKLGSHSKVVYKNDSGKSKDKNNDDFNISPFRYGLTARFGFGNLCFFGDYYFTSMFVENKGPDLHPFSLGLAMTF